MKVSGGPGLAGGERGVSAGGPVYWRFHRLASVGAPASAVIRHDSYVRAWERGPGREPEKAHWTRATRSDLGG